MTSKTEPVKKIRMVVNTTMVTTCCEPFKSAFDNESLEFHEPSSEFSLQYGDTISYCPFCGAKINVS